jgi:hypothetical protein
MKDRLSTSAFELGRLFVKRVAFWVADCTRSSEITERDGGFTLEGHSRRLLSRLDNLQAV